MATIGLRDVYFAPIIEDTEATTTYDIPFRVGKAITANVQPQYNTGELRADDGVAETAESRGVTNVALNTDDLSPTVQSKLLGKKLIVMEF